MVEKATAPISKGIAHQLSGYCYIRIQHCIPADPHNCLSEPKIDVITKETKDHFVWSWTFSSKVHNLHHLSKAFYTPLLEAVVTRSFLIFGIFTALKIVWNLLTAWFPFNAFSAYNKKLQKMPPKSLLQEICNLTIKNQVSK